MPDLIWTDERGQRSTQRITARSTNIAVRGAATIDLTPIAAAPRCRMLSVWLGAVRDIDLAPLANHPGLERVHLELAGRPDLTPLASCTMLREVQLTFTGPEPIDLAPLARCARLEHLQVTAKHGALDLAPLAAAGSITRLSVASPAPLELAPVRQMPGVRKLELGGTAPRYDLAPLRGVPLESFMVSANGWREIDLAPVASPTLRALTLIPLDVTTLDLDVLAPCTALREVNLSPGFASILRVTGLAKLADLETLRFPKYVDLICQVDHADVTCVPLRKHLRRPTSGI